jgi:hypothetical protein
MHYSDKTLDAIARQILPLGFFFYRQYFMWGQTPAIRNLAGTQFYFLDGDSFVTPSQLAKRLNENWRPVALDEFTFSANGGVDSFCAALPSPAPWGGPSVDALLEADRVAHQKPQRQMRRELVCA